MNCMIDLCAANGIYPNIEVIPIEYANKAQDGNKQGREIMVCHRY